MTTIYIPRLIETAEQAEALPDGTLAHGRWPDRQYGDGLVKKIGGAWMPKSVTGIGLAPSNALVGWTALVPIEAEEEWTVGHDAPAWAPGTETWAREFQAHEPGRRLFRRSTTAWEEA
ncbi:hypothetical protein ACTXM8_10235 [Brachybacterium alimentarium]|uniref:hypothetical protein n=1 Tax=Brachybacterium alimentarium TaxID=47845 RepID=UPI003FD1BC2F